MSPCSWTLIGKDLKGHQTVSCPTRFRLPTPLPTTRLDCPTPGSRAEVSQSMLSLVRRGRAGDLPGEKRQPHQGQSLALRRHAGTFFRASQDPWSLTLIPTLFAPLSPRSEQLPLTQLGPGSVSPQQSHKAGTADMPSLKMGLKLRGQPSEHGQGGVQPTSDPKASAFIALQAQECRLTPSHEGGPHTRFKFFQKAQGAPLGVTAGHSRPSCAPAEGKSWVRAPQSCHPWAEGEGGC